MSYVMILKTVICQLELEGGAPLDWQNKKNDPKFAKKWYKENQELIDSALAYTS